MPDTILELSYAAADQVPEAYKSLYVEKDGAFNLNTAMFKGIKPEADFQRVHRALESEKNNHKELRTKWGNFFGDKKPEEIQAILDRVPELETMAAGKVDETKLNEIAEARANSKLAPVARERDQLKASLADKDKIIEGLQLEKKTRAIHDDVRSAATKLKVIDTAMEDVLMLAERMLEVNDEGKIVTKDGVGVTPGVDAHVFLTEMQAKRPHWWPPSSGGGGRGGDGNGGIGGDNPWSHSGWNMTKQGQMVRENPTRAAQLAKLAGTVVGGGRPPAPVKQ
jgi:hypothetical protein